MEHPSDEVLLRFLAGLSSRQENRQVVRHLLARCPECAARLRGKDLEPPPKTPEDYSQAFARVAARLLELTGGAGRVADEGKVHRMEDLPDAVDLMEPAELVEETRQHLLSALAALDGMDRALGGGMLPRPSFHRGSSKRPPRRGAFPRRVV